MNKEIKILITAYDYRPKIGGVATCAYEITKSLSQHAGINIKLISYEQLDGEQFDRNNNFETLRFNISRKSYLAVFQMINFLNKQIKSWQPDVILNFLWHPSGVATYLAKERKINKIPYVVVTHGVELLETNLNLKKIIRNIFSFMKSVVLKNAYRVFAVSNFTAELVKSITKEENNVRVIYNGVNTKEFYPEEPKKELINKYNLQNKTVFLSMTRLEPYKGVDKALEAFKEVAKINKQFTYLICGDGSDEPRIRKLILEYQLQENVIFIGPVPFEQRRDFYNLTDCFILLSRFDKKTPNVEGFGLVFLEAAACTKPSIAGNSGGVSDAVLNKKTGWLVEPENIEQIKSAILECIEFPETRKNLGKNAFKRAVEEMTWEHVTSKIVAEIKNVRD